MNRLISSLLTLFLAVTLVTGKGSIDAFINQLPVTDVEVMERESFYGNIYEIMLEQPLDHNRPDGPTFSQRIYISHVDTSKPVVMVTAGYGAGYYHTSEIANHLKCNQLLVEHRYFGKSVPDSLDWNYLNTWQAATDHHRIIKKFREFYTGKWITTGISKGGQTVMFHSYYYPKDVDARVPYVAPLNSDVEDQRVYEFLDRVGSWHCRHRIHRFQKMALKRQEELIPVFKKFSEKKGYTYEEAGGVEKAFEYCVLEYAFAFWQWGYADCSDIPRRQTPPKELITHMNKVAGFDYFADEFVLEYQPFFYQAYTEMGYYGYDLEEFERHLQHVTEPGFTFALPHGDSTVFNPFLLDSLQHYIAREAENFIFIYGEYDTWSATAVELAGNTNSRVFYKTRGSHRTRIRNMEKPQQEEIYALLESFLEKKK